MFSRMTVEVIGVFALAAVAPGPAVAQELHPQKRLSSYQFDPARPLVERIERMSEERLKDFEQFDEATGYKSYMPTASEKKELAAILERLPERMRKVLNERLVVIYFIEGMKGNGLTDWILDEKNSVFTYMVLNPAGFRKSLSELLGERDKSAFREVVDITMDVGQENRGILYTIVHEGFHAYDYSARVTPYTDENVARATGLPLKSSWQVWDEYARPQVASDYPMRMLLKFYGFSRPNLEAAQLPKVYQQLAGSPFASLYGSRSWAEDASELFFFHHLTVRLGRPYRILYRGARGTEILEPMSNPRVRSRAAKVAEAAGF